MTGLLELKERLIRFFGKNEIYVVPVLKFILATVVFLLINQNIGYMTRLAGLPVTLVLALLCAVLPVNAILLFAFILIAAHLFALSMDVCVVGLILMLVIALLYWFFGTELGCGIRATGSNPAMSRAQGINTSFNVVLGLAVSNGLVALSGALLSQYQGFADVSMGRGAIVIGLAAVIIGEALFSRIFHNFALKLVSVSLGAIIYYIVIQLVLTLGFDANLLKLLSASVVAVFLAVPYWKSKYFAKPAAKKAQKEDAKNA